MKSIRVPLLLAVFVLLGVMGFASEEAMMMRFPDIYKDKIAFSYAGDIWVSNVNGGQARRLTTVEGVEYFPKFSPDGKMIAFTGQHDGYFQVYVIPAEGGVAKQLTFYPIGPTTDRAGFNNQVMDWTPDGKYIVFRSVRYHWDTYVGRYYKVSPDGGWPEALPFYEGATMSYSPDGKKIAMNRNFRDFRTWKRYRGGKEHNIWIYDFEKDKTTKLTDWPSLEINPMWHGDNIYFLSDKNGTMNLYYYDFKDSQIKQITEFKDWDIRWPGFGPDSIIYEQGGKLYKMAFADNKISQVPVYINWDAPYMKPTYENVSRNITEFDLAPTGKRAAFVARGEIFTVPEKEGDTRNITNTSGVRERNITWSPDGNWIAFMADDTGTEELYIMNPLGTQKIQLTKNSNAINLNPVWSPDSKKIAYRDLDLNFYYIDIKTKKRVLIDKTMYRGHFAYAWSPDSNWLTFTKINDAGFASVYLYDLKVAKMHQVTSEMRNNYISKFDPEGKYLYFLSSRDFNPQFGDYELNFLYQDTDRIYLAPLKADGENPFKPESDEVNIEKYLKEKKEKKDKEEAKDKKKKPVKVEIDLKGLEDRITSIPLAPGNYFTYEPIENGVLYVKQVGDQIHGKPTGSALFGYDLDEKKETEMLSGVLNFAISPDNEKLIYNMMGSYGVADVKIEKIDPSKGRLNTSRMEMLLDRKAEWKQMLVEAWRLEKNHFYVKNMHGYDWPKMLQKYMPLVSHLTHRRDLTYIIGEMIGELNIGHAYTGGGDMPTPQNVGTGLLGCEFELDKDGFYTISKIYKGENWNSSTLSPLDLPGLKVKEGDYILEINGQTLKSPVNPYELLKKTMGTIVTLKLNSKPELKDAWDIQVNPVSSEWDLKYWDWVNKNREYVEKKTNGKVGYVHIPDMMFEGLNAFVKQWYGQLHKEGIIIDARFNGGGFVSGLILERLRRFVQTLQYSRLFPGGTFPAASYSGHLVAMANMYSASDGDIFPFFFKEYKLGPVIGTRTWGGVVGIAGYTPLVDGGYVTMPRGGTFSLQGEWVMENTGVVPDIEVDHMPEEEVKGIDPQLDKAIEVIMKKIAEEPVKFAPVPPAPVKK
ncbi:MAG: PD40 domain-containing protein [Acidobacteria bacterium]|nr:PD40 domain-containing protein [Acidobacteriota bacterium]